MKNFVGLFSAAILSFSAVALHADQLSPLGSSSSFAVLGATTVTNTGPTVLSGNLGVTPGSAITGFLPGVVTNGTNHLNDSVSILAHNDALAGYQTLAALTSTANLTGQDLGGLVLTPGVYTFSSSAEITGLLTLNFGGLSDQSFVFQVGSTLTAADASQVIVLNQGANDNVYWQVGSSATLDTTSSLFGTIVADQSISLLTGASIRCGGALALNGAVTLDTNTIGTCSASDDGGPVTATQTPEPGSLGLLGTGVLGVAGMLRRRMMGASC